ncbi:MAG: hypothetical protein OXE59_05315 [Bacteroidetes bacterium]|nr:hypothetical protein [Bacteroidota bacterium]
MWPLSEDTNEVVLLCAWFAGEREYVPLGLQEYNLLASWLYQHDLRPRDLKDLSYIEEASVATGLNLERLTGLLNRRISLGFYLEDWKRRSMWIISRSDDGYPLRIHQHLKSQSPPILFGSGEPSLLGIGGTAVIGPSMETAQLNRFIHTVTELCIQHHSPLIIAGQHPISTQLIKSGIELGNSFIWLRPGKLLGQPLDRPCRDAKASGNITLLSSRSPADIRTFSEEPEIGSLLVAMCDHAIYIDSHELSMDDFNSGEAILRSLPQKKCFVYRHDPVSSLAESLLSNGAHPWIDEEIAIDAGLFNGSLQRQIKQNEPLIETTDHTGTNTKSSPPSGEDLSGHIHDDHHSIDSSEPATKLSTTELISQNGVQGELFD